MEGSGRPVVAHAHSLHALSPLGLSPSLSLSERAVQALTAPHGDTPKGTRHLLTPPRPLPCSGVRVWLCGSTEQAPPFFFHSLGPNGRLLVPPPPPPGRPRPAAAAARLQPGDGTVRGGRPAGVPAPGEWRVCVERERENTQRRHPCACSPSAPLIIIIPSSLPFISSREATAARPPLRPASTASPAAGTRTRPRTARSSTSSTSRRRHPLHLHPLLLRPRQPPPRPSPRPPPSATRST